MSLENKIIDYKNHEKDIAHWVMLKGEYRYETIIAFLESKQIPCSWENITYYIKYDKRLLINSFKYLVFLEEMYKSFISRSGTTKKYKNMSFEQAYYGYLTLGEKTVFDDVDLGVMTTYKKSICVFRNYVVHNKILIGQTFNGCSLEEVLNQFKSILPTSYRSGFVKDINSCSIGLTNNFWHIKL